MVGNDFQPFFESVLLSCLGREFTDLQYFFVGGGCINETVKVQCAEGVFFLKWNEQAPEDMFAAEAAGLSLLEETGRVRVPGVLGHGKLHGKSYLLLEYLEPGRRIANYWQKLGRDLASLHQVSASRFGLFRDNYIGRLPQKNSEYLSWNDFFIENRLKPQVGLAYYNGLISTAHLSQFEQFYPKLSSLLPPEPPSLLHGDLWSGNVHTSPDGSACLIDPAVYYGHREMDLAFTRLFGGFDPEFYFAYHEHYPLQAGWEFRSDIFNLYPLLVHVNLFGRSYLPAVERTLRHYI